jgi:Ca2+/Na+ antiporter
MFELIALRNKSGVSLFFFMSVYPIYTGDEWLVPHLIVFQHKLRISDDVAGCTLLAFGGAAPEIMISTVAVLGGDVDVSSIAKTPVFVQLF